MSQQPTQHSTTSSSSSSSSIQPLTTSTSTSTDPTTLSIPNSSSSSSTTSSYRSDRDRPRLSTARSRGKSFISSPSSPQQAQVNVGSTSSSTAGKVGQGVSSSPASTSTPTPTRPTKGTQRRSTLSTIVSFSSGSGSHSATSTTGSPSSSGLIDPKVVPTSTSTSTSASGSTTTRRSPNLKPKFHRSVSVQNAPTTSTTTTSTTNSSPSPLSSSRRPSSPSPTVASLSTFKPIEESDLEDRESASSAPAPGPSLTVERSPSPSPSPNALNYKLGGKTNRSFKEEQLGQEGKHGKTSRTQTQTREDGVRIEIDGVPLVDSDLEDHQYRAEEEGEDEGEQEEQEQEQGMGFLPSQEGAMGHHLPIASSSTGPGASSTGGRRGRRNRPPSKSVSAVLSGRPGNIISIAQATPALPSLNGHAVSTTPLTAGLTERRRSTDVGVVIINQSNNGQASQTRSRSSSIATHPQFSEMGSGELYARHLPRVGAYDSGLTGNQGETTSSPGPAVRPRSGLIRRISAPNVRSSVGVVGSSLSPGINSIGLGRSEDEILPTIPVSPDEGHERAAGSTMGNSLGLSKISPARSKNGFQRFSPSPSLEPRIMEEPPSLPSSPEIELPAGSIPDDVRIGSSSSPRPGRASLSTIDSVTETGEGGPSYPITPRTSIPRDEHGIDMQDPKNGFSSVLGGVLDGLGKAVGFNLGTNGSRTYASVPADEEEDDRVVEGGRGARRPSWISLGKRRSLEDTDSEKGLTSQDPSDDEAQARDESQKAVRVGRTRRAQDQGSYFFLEPYSNPQAGSSSRSTGDTLPTPALSRASLSGGHARPHGSGRTTSSLFERRNARGFAASLWKVKDYLSGNAVDRPRAEVYGMKRAVSGAGFSSPEAKAERLARGRSDSLLLPKADGDETTVGMNKALRQVAGELGWTLGLIIIVFLSSFGVVAFGIKSMPITSLHSLPKQVSDLQILSAEIRTYMNSSTTGWWHTVAVLMFTGMWKHSWSIPGALILNILVGSLLPPIQAVLLLTVITSFGSLGAYMLSRPLAPLIALLFPKPLAIVRSAIKGNDATAPNGVYQPQKKASDGNGVWRRLLVMRAMGLVPWSGMNVACGVVGVSWLTFLLTTAAGSASWSYVTASVGDILAQLALPKEPGNGDTDPNAGQSISSLLQDPALIAKMVILSLISLIPALFKSRSGTVDTAPPAEIEAELSSNYPHPHVSQDVQSMTPLAPTPSWWQIVNVANVLLRKTTRFAHTGWNAIIGEARDDYRHLHGDDSGART